MLPNLINIAVDSTVQIISHLTSDNKHEEGEKAAVARRMRLGGGDERDLPHVVVDPAAAPAGRVSERVGGVVEGEVGGERKVGDGLDLAGLEQRLELVEASDGVLGEVAGCTVTVMRSHWQ